ncbi:MAG: hypothetical protein ABW133_09515 [Polyangiaceae bacterium]
MGAERNQAIELCGSTMVVVHGVHPPTDAEWQEGLDYTRSVVNEVRGQLVVSAGGGPTPRQRKTLHDLWRTRTGGTPPTAVVTSSAIARGIVTAFSWVVKDRICAFSEKQFAEACAFAGVADVEMVRATVERLKLRVKAGLPSASTESTTHR